MTQGTPEQKEMFKAAVATAPLNRMGTPEEIADACLFLCSTKATFIQGTALVCTDSSQRALYPFSPQAS